MDNLRATVADTIRQILADRGVTVEAIHDEDTLVRGLGLDSLDLAVLVVRLEQQLGCDPFYAGRGATPTFGELVAAYQEACEGAA